MGCNYIMYSGRRVVKPSLEDSRGFLYRALEYLPALDTGTVAAEPARLLGGD